jgi:hypothetical protein
VNLVGPAGGWGQEASEISPKKLADANADLIRRPIVFRPSECLAQRLCGIEQSLMELIRYGFNDPHTQYPASVMNSIKKQIAHDDCLSTMSRALNPLGRALSSTGS